MPVDPLPFYLNEVRRFRTMTSVEEQRQLALLAEGDDRAGSRLAEALLALVADIALAVAPESMSPLKAIERANLVMFRVIQEIPSGDLHDQLREAIVLDLRSAPPSADRRPELPLGRASTGEREGTLVARFGRRGR